MSNNFYYLIRIPVWFKVPALFAVMALSLARCQSGNVEAKPQYIANHPTTSTLVIQTMESGPVKLPHAPEGSRIESVSFSNLGENSIKDLFFYSDIDTSTIGSMANGIQKSNKTRAEKIEGAWKFLIKYTNHDTPADRTDEIHDPVKYVNVYGYGFCDDSSRVLSGIWQEEGFKTRVWGLGGHVVPEVYNKGRWEMWDPDYQKRYIQDDGEVADVEYVSNNPDILENDILRPIFSSKEDNEVWPGGVKGHEIRLDLFPGEKWTAYRNKKELFYRKIYFEKPPPIIFSNNIFSWSIANHLNFTTDSDPNIINNFKRDHSNGSIRIEEYTDPGIIRYYKQSPYIILSALIKVDANIDKNGKFSIFIVKNDEKILLKDWVGVVDREYSIPKKHIYGVYDLKLEFMLDGDNSNSRINDIIIELTCQHNPRIIDLLIQPGRDLNVIYKPKDAKLGLTLNYEPEN